MSIITDKDFLILTQRAAGELRRLLRRPTAVMADLRNIVLPALNDGEVTFVGSSPLGRVVRVRSTVRAADLGTALRFRLCWGELDGKAQMAPDGQRRCVFLTHVDPADLSSAERTGSPRRMRLVLSL